MKTAFLNFYMSALRNMFLTSSIAIGMIGFSDRFKDNNKLLVLLIASFVILLSISFGIHSTNTFTLMLKKASSEPSLSSLDKELIKQSKQWPLFAYLYCGFLTLILLTFIIKHTKKYFK